MTSGGQYCSRTSAFERQITEKSLAEPFWLSYLLLEQSAHPQSLRDCPLLIFIQPLSFENDLVF